MGKKVLFINQEIAPYVPSSEMSIFGADMPQHMQEAGFENLLAQDFETYYETAKSQLNPYRDRHQLKELENLRRTLS